MFILTLHNKIKIGLGMYDRVFVSSKHTPDLKTIKYQTQKNQQPHFQRKVFFVGARLWSLTL